MHRRHLWLVLGALVAAASLMTATVASAGSQAPRKGGTVIFGADQEPNSLNPLTEDHFWSSQINGVVFVGSHILTPSLVYARYGVSKVTVQQRPMRVTYQIKKNFVWWENGKTRPVTAADYIFTWRTVMKKGVESISTTGY